MKSKRLRKCFACHCDHPCGQKTRTKNRISRKDKKDFKKVYSMLGYYFDRFPYDIFTSCDLKGGYKYLKPYFHLYHYFKKNKRKIDFLLKVAENNLTEFVIIFDKGDFTFEWTWEDDNGLYTTDGTMPFIYKTKDFDKTWSGTETQSFLEMLGIKFESVSNDRGLIAKLDIEKLKSQNEENEFEFSEEELSF